MLLVILNFLIPLPALIVVFFYYYHAIGLLFVLIGPFSAICLSIPFFCHYYVFSPVNCVLLLSICSVFIFATSVCLVLYCISLDNFRLLLL